MRSIGGAVRGFGRKVLAKIARVEVSKAAATPPAGECLGLVGRLQAVMAEAGIDDDAAEGASGELDFARILGLPRLNAQGQTYEEFMDAYCDRLEDEAEAAAEAAADAAFRRYLRSAMIYVRLNWPVPGFGMIPLWRNMARLTPKFFQRRICTFGGSAS
jgi:hypothetical protein